MHTRGITPSRHDGDSRITLSGRHARFIIPTLLLYRCWRYFFPRGEFKRERVVAVTGAVRAETITLVHFVPLGTIDGSSIHARVSDEEMCRVLRPLDDVGFYLHGVWHSHPGTYLISSSTDFENQRAEEGANNTLLSAIFVSDGRIRFFTVTLPFEAEVVGKGVEVDAYDRDIIRLTRLTSLRRDRDRGC